MTKQIVALGGGGFSEQMENSPLDDFILGLTGKSNPRICFFPMGSGDAEGYIYKFYARFLPTGARITCLSVFGSQRIRDIGSFLMSQDLIYVGGGNVLNLIALLKVHGIDAMLKKAYDNGTVMAGASAGLLCWYKEFLTDSHLGGVMKPYKHGLGFLSGSACAHYDNPKRKALYRIYMEKNVIAEGIGVEGDVAVHYVDGILKNVMTTKEGNTAYFVHKKENAIVEEPLEATILE